MKQIQIWLGHSTFSTTADIYAHLDFSAQEQSAAAMSGMFQRRETSDKQEKELRRKITTAPMAQRVGFEPTCSCLQTDFESAPL